MPDRAEGGRQTVVCCLQRQHGGAAYFDGVFVSEHMGAEKPTTAYFDKVFAAIPGFEKVRACIVGDSLSSDIKGGKNAGITTIWLRPYHGTHEANADVDVEISSLSELVPLLIGKHPGMN